MKLKRIISGAQTGADQGGLLAGLRLGLETGGFAPRGWRTEAGPMPELAEMFGLIECDREDYRVRTRLNIDHSDATVIFGVRSPGSNMTEEFCRQLGKPLLWTFVVPGFADPKSFESHGIFKEWLSRSGAGVLNCAGNRESKNPGIGKFVEQFLYTALKENK